MKSLKVVRENQEQTYICVHWRTFPPLGAGGDIEALRANQTLTQDQYNRIQIWQRECGLMRMEESKCLACPHRRRVEWKTTGPVLVDPKGVETPILDATTGETNRGHRHLANIFRRPGTRGAYQPAAWVKGEEDGEGDG